MVDIERESRTEVLRRVALTQDAEIRRLLRVNETMRETIVRLEAQLAGKTSDDPSVAAELKRVREILAQRERALFGESSQRRTDTKTKPEPKAKPRTDSKGHGPKPQPALIEQPVEHELDAADRACASCGGHLEEWKGQHETSEEIDVVGVQYILKKHLRKKYRCGCGAAVETALLPEPRLVPGGRYSTDFAIHVAISEYDDDLPLERLAQGMKRAGLEVESQTLWDYLWALYVVLKPVVDRLHVYATSQDVAVVDETTWPLLGVRDRKSKTCYAVAIAVEQAIVYRIVRGRSKDEIASALLGFRGTAVTDGYAAYPAIAAERPGMVIAVCWAHARRKFVEAEKSYPAECRPILDDIGKLFRIERELTEREADVEEIERVREESSRPLVAALGERVARTPHLANSSLGEAITYLRNQWTGLSRFLDDARLPLSTNEVERALRTPVLGRKNVRLRCPDCHVERALAFSCKHRGLCPSCGARRMLDVSAHLTERVFPEVPIRQYVLSPPSELVGLLAAREDVLAAMTRVFVQAIFRGQRERLGASVQSGAVVFVQRFTKPLSVYPHLHVLALDGGDTEGDDGALEFHGDPGPSAEAREAMEDEVETRLSGWLGRRGYLDATPEPRPDDGGWLSAAQESSGVSGGGPRRLRSGFEVTRAFGCGRTTGWVGRS